MDYEKKYKEALEKARQFSEHPLQEDSSCIVEYIFPELKESEDEKIRKRIIDILEHDKKHYLEEIAWLENQREQKPADKVEPKFKVKYAGSEYNVFETKDIAGVTFYGIEDEPNHIDYIKADNCEIISGYGIKGSGSPYPTKPAMFSEQKPQRMISAEAKEAMYDKPAWSEEDEKRFKSCLNILQAKGIIGVTETINTKWLKSLKQRIQHL